MEQARWVVVREPVAAWAAAEGAEWVADEWVD